MVSAGGVVAYHQWREAIIIESDGNGGDIRLMALCEMKTQLSGGKENNPAWRYYISK